MSRKPNIHISEITEIAKMQESGEGDLSQTFTKARLALSEIEGLINHYLPNGYVIYQTSTMQLGIAQSLLPYTVSVEVTKMSVLQIAAEENELYLYLPLQVKVAVKDKGLLLTLMPLEAVMQVQVKARIQMHLKADWQLFTRTEVEQFNWLLSPELRILGVPIGALTAIEKELERFVGLWIGKIDEVIAEQLNFREIALSVWETLQQSFKIWDEPDLWLRCHPQKAYFSVIQIAGKAKQLELLLCVNGKVETTTDTPSPSGTLQKAPLPNALPLKMMESGQPESVVRVVNHLKYQKIAEVIDKHLSQYTFRFFNNRFHLRFGRVVLYAVPDKNKVLAEAAFKGSMRGKAFISFTPWFDLKNKTLVLRNFEFELDTSSYILRLVNRIAGQKLADKLCDTIQELINEQLTELNLFLHQFLSSQQIENVRFESAISEIAIEKLSFCSDALRATLTIKGQSSAQVLLEDYY